VRVWFVLAAIGCGSDGRDVVGPFTGEVRRYVVDRIAVPVDTIQSDAIAADLDGDGKPENQLGVVTVVLASIGDLSRDGADMIAAGALASTVELQADSLDHDPSVGFRLVGADGDPAIAAGGRLVGGGFVSNRTHETRAPGRAVVRLPIFTNADPLALELDGLEAELAPDGTGGFDAIVRGGIRVEHAREVSYGGLMQMFEMEPERHLVFGRGLDRDRDGAITRVEFDDSVISLLVSGDVQLFDGTRYAPRADSTTPDALSVAFAMHLAPCADGRCSAAQPAVQCRDRVRDGDETDVDCGGSCQPCAPARTCGVPADCQTRACDAGRCRAASCSDGVRDGSESDVDCGGACGACAADRRCAADTDCASGTCEQAMNALGTCH
jgi:hypothetical protein